MGMSTGQFEVSPAASTLSDAAANCPASTHSGRSSDRLVAHVLYGHVPVTTNNAHVNVNAQHASPLQEQCLSVHDRPCAGREFDTNRGPGQTSLSILSRSCLQGTLSDPIPGRVEIRQGLTECEWPPVIPNRDVQNPYRTSCALHPANGKPFHHHGNL